MELGLALGYMSLLYFGAMIAPGVGMSGLLMVQMPATLLDWAHAPGYGLLALLLTRGLQRRNWPSTYALAVAAAASFVFGMWTEVFQGSVPGRQPSIDDLMIDGMGIGLAVVVMVLSRGLRNQTFFGRRLDTTNYSSEVIQQEAGVQDG